VVEVLELVSGDGNILEQCATETEPELSEEHIAYIQARRLISREKRFYFQSSSAVFLLGLNFDLWMETICSSETLGFSPNYKTKDPEDCGET
jgi:hypothetical protein